MAAFALWFEFGPALVKISVQKSWHLDQLYTAMFGLLSIITGFLASFYGTIRSMTSGFIGQIQGSDTMDRFLFLLKRAIVLGFIVSILTIPMLIIVPLATEQFGVLNYSVMFWCGAAVWAVGAFFRVASLLFVLFETKVPVFKPGR